MGETPGNIQKGKMETLAKQARAELAKQSARKAIHGGKASKTAQACTGKAGKVGL